MKQATRISSSRVSRTSPMRSTAARRTIAPRDKRISNLPIGVFDSGIGGLTVLQQLHRLMPQENLIYLGDTARVPYGTKSPETVVRFACEDAAFLLQQGVKAVVVACNTVSAWALPTLREEFAVPIFGVIEPGVETALRHTRSGRIGVIGTQATIRSDAYGKAILRRRPGALVYSEACPLLVPLVEEGWTDVAVTREVLKVYLTPLLRRGIDTLILGCTHYPLLKHALQAVAGRGVVLVDSAQSCARFVRRELESLALLRSTRRPGFIKPFVTDEAERFAHFSSRFLGMPSQPATRAELATYSPRISDRRTS